ncbi:hypothetical protein DSECCO2_657770 [anaerobic digester metagenome]
MPPKKTSTRLDITLPISLVEMLRAHADREGLTVSSVIGQAVRAHLDGGGPAPSPSSGQMTLSPADIDSLISQRVEAALQEHLSKLTSPVAPAPVTPEISVPETITITKKPPIHTGKVPVPEDIRKAITESGYTAATLANTIKAIFNPNNDPKIKTITRGTLQGYVTGTASMTSPEYCDQIVKAVEYLESQKKDHPDLSGFN